MGQPLAEMATTGAVAHSGEGEGARLADAELLRQTRRLSMSEHHGTEVMRAPVRYAALPKIEVPERFAGTPGVGSTLKDYMMQIRNAQ
ncbi:unnamed protein product [Closterium sp. NIES-54]